jgi:hypothetical protein
VTVLRGAAWQAEVVESGDRLAVPLATARRIAFCALESGVGTSRLTALAARTLAGARRGRVLVAGLAENGAELLLPTPTAPGSGPLETRVPDAVAEATTAHGSLRGIRAGTASDAVAAWNEGVAPIARFFDVVVADWGVQPVDGGPHGSSLLDAAATAHVVCLVSAAERASSEVAIAAATALRTALPGTDVVVALVDRIRSGSPWPAIAARTAPVPVVPIPHDAMVARTGRAATGTRRAVLGLAGLLMAGADPTARRAS